VKSSWIQYPQPMRASVRRALSVTVDRPKPRPHQPLKCRELPTRYGHAVYIAASATEAGCRFSCLRRCPAGTIAHHVQATVVRIEPERICVGDWITLHVTVPIPRARIRRPPTSHIRIGTQKPSTHRVIVSIHGIIQPGIPIPRIRRELLRIIRRSGPALLPVRVELPETPQSIRRHRRRRPARIDLPRKLRPEVDVIPGSRQIQPLATRLPPRRHGRGQRPPIPKLSTVSFRGTHPVPPT